MIGNPFTAGQPLWRQAVEHQLEGLALVDELLRQVIRNREEVLKHWRSGHGGGKVTGEELHSGWLVDRKLLKASAPFAWTKETTRAVLEASKSIPLDTEINKWNVDSPAVWWYFEEPLPFQTVHNPKLLVRALNFGWIPTEDASFGMPCIAWIDPELPVKYHVSPSMTWEWQPGQTLGDMLDATRNHHKMLYSKGGKWEDKQHTSDETFMASLEGLARFMLAGLVWINQKVVTASPDHVERHIRKEFNRKTGQSISTVQVVQLRRAEHRHGETKTTETEESVREYSHRWVVSGHWRNQPCGPKSGDRRLTYILPYVKGPDDKPLLEPRQKIYEVRR